MEVRLPSLDKLNPFHRAALEVAQELHAARKRGAETKAVPFGKEPVSKAEFAKRLRADRTLRELTLAEPGGQRRILDALRK